MALEINGEFVDDAVIRAEARTLRPRCTEMLAECDPLTGEMRLRELAREQVIKRVLLRQEAERFTSHISPATIEQTVRKDELNCVTPMNEGTALEDAKTQLRLDVFVGNVLAKVAKPKPKEVADYYRRNPQEFAAPEMVHAAHIIKNVDEATPEAQAREAIDEIWRLLEQGAEFSTLANTHSDCPGNGGDLGWFPRGQMVPEFDEVVFALEPGQVSPVFRTSFGFHIAMVLDRRQAGKRSFEEVREKIENGLHRHRQQNAMESLFRRLREQARIQDVKRPRPS